VVGDLASAYFVVMKKTNRTLKLRKDTIRNLTPAEAGRVVGAVSDLCTAGTCSVNDTCVCKCTNDAEQF
jgi:hypothetical protein